MSSCASRFKQNVSHHVNAFLRQDDILPYKEYLFLKSISSRGGLETVFAIRSQACGGFQLDIFQSVFQTFCIISYYFRS